MLGHESVCYCKLASCMSTTPACVIVALQVEITIQTTLGVAIPKFSVDIPERLSCVAQSAEFPIFVLSPRGFCFVVLRAHLADGMLALA